jgi:hypothetical protein
MQEKQDQIRRVWLVVYNLLMVEDSSHLNPFQAYANHHRKNPTRKWNARNVHTYGDVQYSYVCIFSYSHRYVCIRLFICMCSYSQHVQLSKACTQLNSGKSIFRVEQCQNKIPYVCDSVNHI